MSFSRLAPLLLAPLAASCGDSLVGKSDCFSVTSANDNQPYAALLLDRCEGKTWLLVRSPMGNKPEDGHTYQWYALDKYDFTPPVLVDRP